MDNLFESLVRYILSCFKSQGTEHGEHSIAERLVQGRATLYNMVALCIFLFFVIFVGYRLNAWTSESIRLDGLHRNGQEEITVYAQGEGTTLEKAEYDAKRQANNKIFGERVHGKTEMRNSSHNEQRDRGYDEISGSEFDSRFKSITIIKTWRQKNEDGDMVYFVQIRAVGIREINTNLPDIMKNQQDVKEKEFVGNPVPVNAGQQTGQQPAGSHYRTYPLAGPQSQTQPQTQLQPPGIPRLEPDPSVRRVLAEDLNR
jgi:hypothetical protein